MAYRNIVFVKLEKRLLNDWRWYMLSETSQLNYIRFILCAADTYNRIPMELMAIKKLFKTSQRLITIENSIKEIMANFPKFKAGEGFYYFEGFEEKTNWVDRQQLPSNSPAIAQQVTDKDKEEDKEEDKSKRGLGRGRLTPPTTEQVKDFFKGKDAPLLEAEKFFDYFSSNGWKVGGRAAMKDWQAAARNWIRKLPPSVKKPVYKPEPIPERPEVSVEDARKVRDLVSSLSRARGV